MNDRQPSPAERLTAAEHNRSRETPNQKPKHAATLILLDHSGKEPTVLMGRRNPAHKFMPGKFVFPGGRLDPVDRRMSFAEPLNAEVEEKLLTHLSRRGPVTAGALALRGDRETFEETGLVLGAKAAHGNAKIPEGVWRDYAAHGFAPDLSRPPSSRTPSRRRAGRRRTSTPSFCGRCRGDRASGGRCRLPASRVRRASLDPPIRGEVPRSSDCGTADDPRRARRAREAGFGHHLPVAFLIAKQMRGFRRRSAEGARRWQAPYGVCARNCR